jgi:hypothetical protein
MSVVRNQAYQKSAISIRERHNERQNETYYNSDIQKDRQGFNAHYKRCEGSYTDAFNAMVAAGVIKTRGQKKDGSAKIIDELVFDVNTEYFDSHGGYEYAKSFFEEAYRYAVKEIGGEQFVISAVMHADERHKALSEKHGRDIHHFHLHVVYVPVVDKEVKWTTRCKDPALVGAVKETIKQVSHAKKWPRYKTDKGWVNSYSLLQDRYFEHMKEAGFEGFERGERGSTAEHLSVLEYKAKMEAERAASIAAEVAQKQEAAAGLDAAIEDKGQTAAALDTAIEGKAQAAAKLDAQAEKKQQRLDKLDDEIVIKGKVAATIAEIDTLGKPNIFGGVNMPANEAKKLKALAKKGVTIKDSTAELKRKLKTTEAELATAKAELAEEVKKRPSIAGQLNWWGKFLEAMKRAPKRLIAVIEEILREPPERGQREQAEMERAAPRQIRKNHER